MNPKYPIYIVSKGRWETRLTSKALERINVPYYIVVEAHERDQYAAVIDPAKVLVLPEKYLQEYDTCDDVGEARGKGPVLLGTSAGITALARASLATG